MEAERLAGLAKQRAEIVALIDSKIKERNWLALGDIYRSHLKRFKDVYVTPRSYVFGSDIGAKIKASKARTWEALRESIVNVKG